MTEYLSSLNDHIARQARWVHVIVLVGSALVFMPAAAHPVPPATPSADVAVAQADEAGPVVAPAERTTAVAQAPVARHREDTAMSVPTSHPPVGWLMLIALAAIAVQLHSNKLRRAPHPSRTTGEAARVDRRSGERRRTIVDDGLRIVTDRRTCAA